MVIKPSKSAAENKDDLQENRVQTEGA